MRLGCSQDFADDILPTALARFSVLYPLVMVELRIDGNAALVDAIEKNELDVALAIGRDDKPSADVVGSLDLVWIAGREFTASGEQPLPLVMLGPQCAFRRAAIGALDDAGVARRIAATSPSVAGIWAAARGGLGITARSALGLPASLEHAPSMFGLPRLGAFPITLHTRRGRVGDGVKRLRDIVRESVGAMT